MVEVREAGGPLDRLITRGPPTPSHTPKRASRRLMGNNPLSSSNLPSSDGPDVPMSSPAPVVMSTPTSSAESSSTNNGRKKKRVEFSPYNQYHPPVAADQKYPPALKKSNSALNAPPSRSILKPYQNISAAFNSEDMGTLPDFNQPEFSPATFGEMLESIVKALASTERSKKSDAYASFSNVLKAYDVVPDQKALMDKTGLLCSFIKRDLNIKIEDDGNGAQDLMMVKQALKVLSILAWMPFLKDVIDDDDGIFFLQWAITAIEQSTSKALINSCLHFLAIQNFNNRVLNPERAGKIITVVELKNKQTNASSVSAIVERIGIYGRLLQQARPVMILRAPDWVDHLFESMLSPLREVRTRSIALATETAKTIGMEKNVSRAVYQLLGYSSLKAGTNGNVNQPKSQNMFETVKEKLESMLASGDKEQAIHVPQIWGNVVALLRGLTIPFDKWEHFSPWLTVISKCFNSSDIALKVQAHAAWAKVIYLANISASMPEKRWDLVGKPIAGYLHPSKLAKNSKIARDAAMKNVNTLLYYGFRPNSPPEQLNMVWERFVIKILEKDVLSTKSGASSAALTLGWLFDPSPPQAKWNEYRALDTAAIMSEELPRIDPKWVRLNSFLVLKTLETAFQNAYWMDEGLGHAPEMWRKFNACVAAAGSKEVKASAELLATVANIFNLFQRMWVQVPPTLTASPTSLSSFVEKFTALVTIALEVLKPLCFTESKLSHDNHSNFAAVLATPSGRSSSGSPSLVTQSPALHLFALLMKPSKELSVDDKYMGCIENFLWTCVESRDSRRKRLGLLTEAMSILPTKDADSIHFAAWEILSELAARSMPLLAKEQALSSPSPAGHDFREAVRILGWGCQNGGATLFPAWEALFLKLRETVQREFGEAEVCSAIIQPLADILRQHSPSEHGAMLKYANVLLQNSTFPKARSNPEAIQRNLYGMPSRKLISTVDPFEALYRMLNSLLPVCFDIIQDQAAHVEDAISFFNALVSFIGKIPIASLVKALRQLQEGLIYCVETEASTDASKAKALELWNAVLDALSRQADCDSAMLQQIGPLLAAGLRSNRSTIVSSTLTYWNKSFGLQQELTYPSPVRQCLGRLKNIADILLPTFPDLGEDEIMETPPRFSETQTEDDIWSEQSRPSIFKMKTPRLQLPAANLSGENSREVTPTKSAKRTNVGRKLRHMDSQIHFESIVSDAVDEDMESQLLTERQKEVKERQANETLFKDVGAVTPVKSTRGSNSSPQSSTPQAKLVLRLATPDIPSSGGAKSKIEVPETLKPITVPRSFLKSPKLGDESNVPSSPLARASARKSQPRKPADAGDEIPSSPPGSPKMGPVLVTDPDDPFVDNHVSDKPNDNQPATSKSRGASMQAATIRINDDIQGLNGNEFMAGASKGNEMIEEHEEEETDRDEDIPDRMDVVEETVIDDTLLSPSDDGEVSRQLRSELSMSQSFTEEIVSPVSPVEGRITRSKAGRARRASGGTRKRKRDLQLDLRAAEPFSDANTPNISDEDALDCIVVSARERKEATQFETAPTELTTGLLEVVDDALPPKKKLKSPSPAEIPPKAKQNIPNLRKTRSWLGSRTAAAAPDAGMFQGSDPSGTATVDDPKAKAPEEKPHTKLETKQRHSLPSTFRTRRAGAASSADATTPSSETTMDTGNPSKSPATAKKCSNFSVTIPVKRTKPQEATSDVNATTTANTAGIAISHASPTTATTTDEPAPEEEYGDETETEPESESDEMSNVDMIGKLNTSLGEFGNVVDNAYDQLDVLKEAENMLWKMMSKVRLQKAALSRRPVP